MIYNSYDNVGLIKVLSFLKSHDTEYLSGQDLSDVLKISRVAVWKHIEKIRSLGYKIESKQKLGYKLVENTKLMLPWEITEGIKTKKIGKRAYYFDSIDSTQNYAIKIASNPKEDGTIIIAEKQTGGKGRRGRKWLSPKGGIWFSIILHPKFELDVATVFPLAVSLALALAIKKTLGIKTELKWPNDVLLDEKKVAGILTDTSIESNKIENLVLGVGINFNINSKQIEKQLEKSKNFYGASSLVKDDNASKINLIHSFLGELENLYEDLNSGKSQKVIKEWMKYSSTIGKEVTISDEQKKITGKAKKIDSDGALIVIQQGKEHKVFAGDVIHR